MSFNQSFEYTRQLQEQGAADARHGRFQGDILTGATLIGFSHWLGNRRRKKLGLPQEPMSNIVGIPMAVGLGYVFWWAPFLIYMLIAYTIHIPLLALLITVGIFLFAFMQWKKYRARKYMAYYTAKAVREAEELPKPVNNHAPGSDEWLAQTSDRIRRNIFGPGNSSR